MDRNQFLIPIDKLTYWKSGTWVQYEAKSYDLSLRVYCDQLFISNNNKLLESINMNGKMKGIYKDDVLILLISNGIQEIRKIKFQIKFNAALCLQKLGEHFLVQSHNSSSKSSTDRYLHIENVFKNMLQKCESDNTVSSVHLPSNFSNFVKLCFLDPAFPNFVRETQNIIDTEIIKK